MFKLDQESNSIGRRLVRAAALVLVLSVLALPAGAARLFTVDFDGDNMNDLDGSDDLQFSFAAGGGQVDGFVRAVNITGVNRAALTNEIAFYQDFLGNFPGGADFDQMDTLIFDVVLSGTSVAVDDIGVAVSTDPLYLNPDGAGYLNACTPGIPLGCRDNVPVGQLPDDVRNVAATPPSFPFPGFPGAAGFSYGFISNSLGDNLNAGETTIRLFVSWADPAGDPSSPLNQLDQKAKFTIRSGAFVQDFETDIVPEPGTALMVGLGLAMLAGARKRQRR